MIMFVLCRIFRDKFQYLAKVPNFADIQYMYFLILGDWSNKEAKLPWKMGISH